MYGKLYDTYEIEAEIGSGGCGAVYKAWHKRLNKHIVLKELRDSSQKTVEVQRNEIEALKNIKSMYIPQVFDYLSENSSTYTVMEYVEGDSFDKLLPEGKMFSPAQVTKWYYQLATALEALHKNDVCHRDIKPANIIYRTNGDVCLIDFNSALVRGNNTRVVNRSSGYASPEQYHYFQMCEEAYFARISRHAADVDYPRRLRLNLWLDNIDWKLSDIYSLGATMYHLLTGRRPVLRTDGGFSHMATGELSTGVEGIIERCMRTDPAERFASAHDLRYALLQNRAYPASDWRDFLPC